MKAASPASQVMLPAPSFQPPASNLKQNVVATHESGVAYSVKSPGSVIRGRFTARQTAKLGAGSWRLVARLSSSSGQKSCQPVPTRKHLSNISGRLNLCHICPLSVFSSIAASATSTVCGTIVSNSAPAMVRGACSTNPISTCTTASTQKSRAG